MARKNTKEKIDETVDQPEVDETGGNTNDFDDAGHEEQVDPLHDQIKAAFLAASEADSDEDTIKMAMIQVGAKFKNVAKLYNTFMVEFGFVKSKTERNEILDSILTGADLVEEEVFDVCVEEIQRQLEVGERNAASYLRQWAKRTSTEYFKPEKAASGEGRSSFNSRMYDWILDNINATQDEFLAYLEQSGTPNTMRFTASHLGIFEFVQKIKAKYAAA